MRFAVVTTLLLLTALATVVAQEYTTQAFKEKVRGSNEDEDIIRLCREFMTNAEDIDAIREAQNVWLDVDPEGVREFCDALSEANPKSARHLYLRGRITEDARQQVLLGRQAIALDPDWPYGYRLLLATYVTKLFDADEEDRVQSLAAELPGDRHLFAKLVELDGEETYPYEFQFSHLIYDKDYQAALETLQRAEALDGNWPTGLDYARLYAHMARYDDVLPAVEREIDRRVEESGWPAEDRDEYVQVYYTDAMRKAGAYEPLIAYLMSKPADKGVEYDIACSYALMGNKEKAFAHLTKSAELGWEKVRHIERDSDLESLRNDPRWETFQAAVATNWEAGKPERKQEALAERMDEAAPAWALVGVDGDSVRLTDLRGNVVVLDFWATWCNPCRLAMPAINEFTRKNGNDKVKVFSVNVWERGKRQAREFMKENDYAMTLLYGNDELAKAYGVQGIPHLCVIDTDGKIRFVESGYEEGLQEKLAWWTEDCLNN